MGATKDHKDLFVEIGWMTTGGYTGGQGVLRQHTTIGRHRPPSRWWATLSGRRVPRIPMEIRQFDSTSMSATAIRPIPGATCTPSDT